QPDCCDNDGEGLEGYVPIGSTKISDRARSDQPTDEASQSGAKQVPRRVELLDQTNREEEYLIPLFIYSALALVQRQADRTPGPQRRDPPAKSTPLSRPTSAHRPLRALRHWRGPRHAPRARTGADRRQPAASCAPPPWKHRPRRAP